MDRGWFDVTLPSSCLSAFEYFEYLLTLSRRGLILPASDLIQYVCTLFAMLELCDSKN